MRTVTSISLLLASYLTTIHHPPSATAIGGTLVLTVLITAARNPILYISSLGSLGMAIGAIIDHRPILSCCLSPFAPTILLSWPTLLMFAFCLAGSLVHPHNPRDNHPRASCNWGTFPAMYLSMCVAGRYLSTPLQPIFGLFLAVHWAMFIGMAAGHWLSAGLQLPRQRPLPLFLSDLMRNKPGRIPRHQESPRFEGEAAELIE